MSRVALAIVAALMHGCAALAPPGSTQSPQGPPTEAGDVGRTPPPATMSPASASLLTQGRAQREAGETAQASSTLERAIRIDPHQPSLWLELARVRMQEGNYAQAEQMARKAASVSATEARMQAQIDDLIAEARRRQGLRSPLD